VTIRLVAIDGKTQACSEKTYLFTCGHYHDYIDNNAIGACVKNASQNHTIAPLWYDV
jgi:hypothetical protein